MIFKNFEISDIKNFIKFINSNIKDTIYFHPHKFDYSSILKILINNKKDVYILLINNNYIVGYGLLRGWDDGYSIPSIGILLDSNFRGKGYSRILMLYLHKIAKDRGSEYIILTVYKNNESAIKLYKKLGYSFEENDILTLKGVLKIN